MYVKLSVVVPVYNVSPFLHRCLESLLRQSVADSEVILVDDGSTDGSGHLCDEWCASHERFRVVHQENKGLSEARNTGIRLAAGEWITFVDSDDFLAPDTHLRVMQQLREGDDMIEFPMLRFYGSEKQSLLNFVPNVCQDATRYWIENHGHEHAYACNKIFHASVFRNVRFPVGVIFEDVHTMPLVLREVRQIRQTDVGLYYYCHNPRGITATATGAHLLSLLHAHLDHWDVTRSAEYYLHVVNIQLDVCRLTGMPPILPKAHNLPMAHLPLRLKIKVILLKLFGINGLCFINKLLWKIRRAR